MDLRQQTLDVGDALLRFLEGSLLPPEPQLCQRFAVSRHTVREAVRLLCDQGLVSRHQGVGTKVRATQSEKRYVASLSSLRDLMEYAQQTRLKYLGSKWVDADAALAAGARAYWTKPIDFPAFLANVRALLQEPPSQAMPALSPPPA